MLHVDSKVNTIYVPHAHAHAHAHVDAHVHAHVHGTEHVAPVHRNCIVVQRL